jgi:CBS domain-containing protein
LAPFLGSLVGVVAPARYGVRPAGAVPLEVELDREALDELKSSRLAFDDTYEHDGGVDELMCSNPVVVAPEDTLGEVAERLLERGQTAAAVAEYGQLIGILTTGDLVRASAMRVHPSEARVRQWMTAEPVTVAASSSIAAAALLAREYGIHHLPVVEGDRPVGMLYLDDALRQAGVPIGLGL